MSVEQIENVFKELDLESEQKREKLLTLADDSFKCSSNDWNYGLQKGVETGEVKGA